MNTDPRLNQEIRALTMRLGEIIRELAGESCFQRVEKLRQLPMAAPGSCKKEYRSRPGLSMP